jgi:putative ABC transport system permease protein
VDQTAGLTYSYRAGVSDRVGFKKASANIIGVDGQLNNVLFTELVEFSDGGLEAFDHLLEDNESVIISEGLATHLAVSTGDVIKIQGEGNDHIIEVRIIALARKIPGVEGIGRSRVLAESDSTILMALDNFRALITEMDQPPFGSEKGVLEQILFTLSPEAEAREVADVIGKEYNKDYRIWARFLDVALEQNQASQATQRIFLLSLTTIAFTTAVFGVFAVIYVTIYARRIEIGMMKAMGMRRRELTGMLNIESITMTLGAALAGITAGAAMGYIIFFGERALSQRPTIFAVDTTVIPFIVIMIVLASMIGATLSARRIVKKRAVEILRMQ